MATRMCDICGIRPAVVTVRRIIPGKGQRVEQLCEIHAAEAGLGRSSLGVSPTGLEETRQGRRPVAEVTAEDIAEVVSRATGIPVSQLTEEERERLMRLEEQLHERVVGQD